MKAWLFDVDGVLTDLHTKQLSSPQIITELNNRLVSGNIIGLITGRSLDFVISRIVNPMEQKISDKFLLTHMVTIAENGSILLKHNHLGDRQVFINPNSSIPSHLADEIKQLVSQPKYSGIMFYDVAKQTMVTIEMITNEQGGDESLKTFKKAQTDCVQEIKRIIYKQKLELQIKIDSTRIAIDVENVHVGKGYATAEFVKTLEENDIKPQEYVEFGDSHSDYEMHEKLIELHKHTTFVYVANENDLAGKNLDNVIFTKEKYVQGTLEYLQT